MFEILAFSKGVNILLTIIILALMCLLVYLLFKSIKKAQANIMDNNKNLTLNSEKFDYMITKKLENDKKCTFTIFQIEINDYINFKKTYGDLQYESGIMTIIDNISDRIGTRFKIFAYNDELIYIYSKNRLGIDIIKKVSKIVIEECQKTIILAGALTMEIEVNVGVVMYPGCGHNLLEVKQNLSVALLNAKRKGLNTYSIYDSQLGNKDTDEYKTYLEIKEAIASKEFLLYYQPIVNLKDLEVYASEALLRWEHKTQGILSPNAFLNILEKTGDINWVGFWSLEQLIRQQLQWKQLYPDRNNIILSMNLSPKQLMNANLIEELRRIVKRYKINAQDYCMEIIQFAMFDKVSIVQENIQKLSQMGFKIAIDNFGLEFSTLQTLQSLKVDIIKLDKSFISATKNNEMSKSIAQMLIKYADENNIIIIAEGIEDAEVLNYVKEMNIKYGQGYFFSKPKNAKETMQDIILTPWSV